MKVLIIEDSAEIVEAISLCLQLRWPEAEISSAAEGSQGISLLKDKTFDIIILDINLPDIDGFEVLEQVRSFSNIPTIFLTVRGREEDQARGLEIGADDYIVKPFKPRDLVARVNAILRRSNEHNWSGRPIQTTYTGLSTDISDNKPTPREVTIQLTPAEARLLRFMVERIESTLDDEPLPLKTPEENPGNQEQLRTVLNRLKGKLSINRQQQVRTDHNRAHPYFTGPS